MGTKKCNVCEETKDSETGFSKNKRVPDGYDVRCKMCDKAHKEARKMKASIRRQFNVDWLYKQTTDTLSEWIVYDPITGVFSTPTSEAYPLSYDNDGYARVSINGASIGVHRLAWFLSTSIWPEEVDHINGDRSDNKLVNLTGCSHRENMSNLSIHRKGKLLGALYKKQINKWQSCGEGVSLGYYKTEREASLEYCKYVLKNRLVRREFLHVDFTDAELGI